MFNTFQNKRPMGQPQPQNQNPLFQQQTRSNQSQALSTSSPRSQMEAMPPDQTGPYANARHTPPVFDPATMHPVFFMNSWRKPPFAMPPGPSFHPVATGYVFGDMKNTSKSNTKL